MNLLQFVFPEQSSINIIFTHWFLQKNLLYYSGVYEYLEVWVWLSIPEVVGNNSKNREMKHYFISTVSLNLKMVPNQCIGQSCKHGLSLQCCRCPLPPAASSPRSPSLPLWAGVFLSENSQVNLGDLIFLQTVTSLFLY